MLVRPDERKSWGGIHMRAIKVLLVTVSVSASMIVGVAATAAPSSGDAPVATRWCC
jgi:hypothetical protein